MTKENKELLLKDLCGRLYTKTWVNYNDTEGCDYELTICTLSNFPEEQLKPYLRSMSSMTEEEGRHYNSLLTTGQYDKLIDWLNEYKFDYRYLIPMDLAIEAPEDMYKEKVNL